MNETVQEVIEAEFPENNFLAINERHIADLTRGGTVFVNDMLAQNHKTLYFSHGIKEWHHYAIVINFLKNLAVENNMQYKLLFSDTSISSKPNKFFEVIDRCCRNGWVNVQLEGEENPEREYRKRVGDFDFLPSSKERAEDCCNVVLNYELSFAAKAMFLRLLLLPIALGRLRSVSINITKEVSMLLSTMHNGMSLFSPDFEQVTLTVSQNAWKKEAQIGLSVFTSRAVGKGVFQPPLCEILRLDNWRRIHHLFSEKFLCRVASTSRAKSALRVEPVYRPANRKLSKLFGKYSKHVYDYRPIRKL